MPGPSAISVTAGALSFAGEFETHLTVAPEACSQLADWAIRHDVKYTRIVLDEGRHTDQPMLTVRGDGTLADQLAAAGQWVSALTAEGFAVVRVKIEASPWNADVPVTADQARRLDGYFEHHLKLRLADTTDLRALRDRLVPHHAHLSRNARRALGDGRHERFVTQRRHGDGRSEAQRALAALAGALTDHTIVEVEQEYVVYDDHPAIDAGWLS